MPITLDRVLRWVLVAASVAAAAWLLWFFSDLVLYLVVGAVLAYLLNPVVNAWQGQGLGRVAAVLLTFAMGVALLALAAMLLVPFLGEQVAGLRALVSPERLAEASTSVEEALREVLPVAPGAVRSAVLRAVDALFQQERIATTFAALARFFANVVYALVIVPLVVFFFLKDGRLIQDRLLALVPNPYFELTLALVAKVEGNLGRYFRALFLQAVSVATVATALLLAVGLDGAVLVGVFTALANTIPYFGPALGFLAGAAVGVAQTGDLSLVPWVLAAMAATQLADNFLFQPIYFSRAARTHPLIILCAVLAGAEVAGILGMLVAIPVLTVLRVTVAQVLWSLRNYRVFNPGRPRAPAAAVP